MERGNGILRYHYADATRADDAWSCIRRRFYALQTAAAAHAPKPGNRAISMPRRPRRARSAPVRPFQAKRVIYVDSETWFAPYVDTYSRDGQLFQECPLLAGLSRPGGPGSARRHLSFPASIRGRSSAYRPAKRLRDDVLSAWNRNPGTRMLVRQYGRGNPGLFHHSGDEQRGTMIAFVGRCFSGPGNCVFARGPALGTFSW